VFVTRHRLFRRIVGRSGPAVLAVALLGISNGYAAPAAVPVAVERVRGDARGVVTVPFDAPGTPLLEHFFFAYSGADHHLAHLAVQPQSNDTMMIAFHDENRDDEYSYNIGHERMTAGGIVTRTYTDVCVGSCVDRALTAPPGTGYAFVLRGFRFFFNGSEDHHIDAIGIRETDGRITTWFNDQNDDDTYWVTVDYAWVPRSLLDVMVSFSGTASRTNTAFHSAVPGPKVLRGFAVDNVASGSDGDNHIVHLGIVPSSEVIAIYYGDWRPSDSADWRYEVRYAVLA
jgi:hypothetical protein